MIAAQKALDEKGFFIVGGSVQIDDFPYVAKIDRGHEELLPVGSVVVLVEKATKQEAVDFWEEYAPSDEWEWVDDLERNPLWTYFYKAKAE